MKAFTSSVSFLFLFLVSLNSTLLAQDQKIYWAKEGKIKRANLDGSNQEVLLEALFQSPQDIEFESGEAKLYWCDAEQGTVQRSNLDGSEFETLFQSESTDAYRMAVNGITRKIYWVDAYGYGIYEHLIDGGDGILIASVAKFGSNILDFEIHPSCDGTGCLFWIEQGYDESFDPYYSLIKMSLNNFEIQAIYSDSFPIADLSIDRYFNRIYFASVIGSWTAPSTTQIYSMEFDGSDLQVEFQLTGAISVIEVDGAVQKIYWLDSVGNVLRANFDGSGQEVILYGEQLLGSTNLVVDSANSKIYSVNPTQRKIKVSDIGGFTEDLLTTPIIDPETVAVDSSNRRMYWTDRVTRNIYRARLDGTEIQSIYVMPSNYYSDKLGWLVINPAESKLYWSEVRGYEDEFRLQKADLDGLNSTNLALIEASGITHYAGPFALDIHSGKIYWSFSKRPFEGAPYAEILRLNLDGSGAEVFRSIPLPSYGISYGVGIAVDPYEGWVYYENPVSPRRIERIRTDGSELEIILQVQAYFLMLDSSQKKIYWSNYEGVRRLDLGVGGTMQAIVDGEFPKSIALDQFPSIVSSQPPSCSIDARQLHHMENEAIRYGLTQLELQYSSPIPALSPIDFTLSQFGSNQLAPVIQSVQAVGENSVRLNFSHALQPGSWTCVTSNNGGGKVCLGYLPGDINADAQVNPSDILYLIDNLNGVVQPASPIWQTDINRSGSAEPSDILRLIDLLNGAGAFIPWNGASLPACPGS